MAQAGGTRWSRALIAASALGAALFAAAGCSSSSGLPLLHNSLEGVPGCHDHCLQLSFASPVGKQSVEVLQPYVCSAAGPVHIDRVTLLDPTPTARLDRWGFYNGVNGGLDGAPRTLDQVHATSHVVWAPCSAKWRQVSVLYVVVHRAGPPPAIFYGVQLHYRALAAAISPSGHLHPWRVCGVLRSLVGRWCSPDWRTAGSGFSLWARKS